MIKNIITLILLLTSVVLFAQNDTCKAASDSVRARKDRGEIAYFYPAKYLADQYFYIVFQNNKYSKKQFPVGSLSKDFMTCFNQSSQKNLDSVFKVDFFRKTDSILNIYDKAGNGYRNTDFPGGAFALQTFLNKNVVLPEGAKPKDADKFIRVYYSFIVDESGVISDISLVKSNCKECEAAVLSAVQKLPNFIAATEAGKLKKLKYILPFMKKF
jgi:hypothetical protein